MKRQYPSDNRGGGMSAGGGAKRYRNENGYADALAQGKYEFRFLIPTKCAGAVIGKGGEKIKAMRDKVRFGENGLVGA
jgi:heterogeneous nuclear ribonucleoprotein K